MDPSELSPMAPSEERDRLGREGSQRGCTQDLCSLDCLCQKKKPKKTCKDIFAGGGRVPEGQWDIPALAEASSGSCSSAAEGKRRRGAEGESTRANS